MTKHDELTKQIEGLKAKITELEATAAALKVEQEKEAEWPKKGDRYFFIESRYGVATWLWADTDADSFRRSLGNLFRTEEEAEKELEARTVVAELRRQPGRRKFGPGMNQAVGVQVDFKRGSVVPYHGWCDSFGMCYFVSQESVEAAIKAVGAERILQAAKWFAMGE